MPTRLTIKQLRYLIAIEETLHFRRAAEREGISQPTMSAQLQTLETTLNVQLVERSRSNVALTPVGREVARRAKRVLEEAQGIIDFAASGTGGLVGTIRLGTKSTLGPYLLPYVVEELHRAHPELKLYVQESEPKSLEFELSDGKHDVLLTQLPIAGSDYVTERLFREPLYVAMAQDHPLAERQVINTADLYGQHVLMLKTGFHLHDQIYDLCQDFGAIPVRDYEGSSLDTLRLMVGMGMGISFLPALYVHSELEGRQDLVVRPFKGRQVTRSIGLVWRKSAGREGAYKKIARVMQDIAFRDFQDLVVEARISAE